MYNLLTGKFITAEHPKSDDRGLIEEPWTAEAHRAAMRRLLHAASKPVGTQSATHLIAAARAHAEAAKTAGHTPLPVKTAPARTMPRDGDTIR